VAIRGLWKVTSADDSAQGRRQVGIQWPSIRWTAGALLTMMLPLVAAGCISVGIGGGGKPLPSLVTLTPAAEAPAGQTLSSTSADPLVVLSPEVDRTLATTRIPVQINDSAVAYLTGAAWLDQPGHLFQDLLIETIRARGKRLVLDHNLPQTVIRLSGRLDAMGYDARSRSVTVRFDALRVGRDGVTTTRRFEAVEKDIGPLAADVTPALNLAANDVAGQVADWVD
jgi:cholesterol transport system auxiliary component